MRVICILNKYAVIKYSEISLTKSKKKSKKRVKKRVKKRGKKERKSGLADNEKKKKKRKKGRKRTDHEQKMNLKHVEKVDNRI